MKSKIIKGETMSASNGGQARTRLSLLAGGSLAAAALLGGAPMMLAPTAALAANECGDPNTNTTGADTFDCAGTFPEITYTTNGNLTLRMNNGVATTTGGVVVSSSGAHTVTISRLDPAAGSGDPSLVGANGAGVQVLSAGTGAITVNLSDGDTGDAPLVVSGTTYGIRLSGGATAGNAVAVTTTNGQVTATAGIGVQATNNSTTGGNILLTLGGGVSGTSGGVSTTINGTGTQTITLSAQSATVSGGDVGATTGPAVQMTTVGIGTGASTLTVGGARTVRANGTAAAVVDIANANGARTITNNGTIRSNDAASTGYDDLAISVGAGSGAVTISNTSLTTTNAATGASYPTATLTGRIVLENSGNATINNNAAAAVTGGSIWHTAGGNVLGAGNTTLNNNTTTVTVGDVTSPVNAVIATNAGGMATTLDFSAGTDTFNNRGILAVGEGTQAAATLTITNLESWNNSGLVLFGANGDYTGTDGVANDRIIAATNFTGSGTSTLGMDVDFTGTQGACSAAVIADCLDLRGGTAGGTTSILVNAIGESRGLDGRIVLVDVGGGFSDADRFVIDPRTTGYALNADGDGIIDAGILHYDLHYDADTQQHFLLGAPDTEAMEPGLFPTLARSTWDLATGTWFGRGLDLRNGLRDGGAWVRVTGSKTDYSITQSFTSSGVTTDYDTGYEQDGAGLVTGMDLIRAAGDSAAWVFGLTGGYAETSAEFNGSESSLALKGYFLGGYTSFVAGPFFLDAIVNAAKFDLSYDVPGLSASIDDGEATSLGFQAETGWLLKVPGMPAHIEPLAALSYVRTTIDDLALPGVEAVFEDTGFLRAGLGVRISGDAAMSDWTTRLSFTGRVWEELNGESEFRLTNDALDLPLTYDDHSDRLGEVGFAVDTLGVGERISLRFAAGMQFRRDYENRQLSVGARYRF